MFKYVIYLNVSTVYIEVGSHFKILNVLLPDYFERRGEDTFITIIGHRYAGAISINSQPLYGMP